MTARYELEPKNDANHKGYAVVLYEKESENGEEKRTEVFFAPVLDLAIRSLHRRQAELADGTYEKKKQIAQAKQAIRGATRKQATKATSTNGLDTALTKYQSRLETNK